MPANPLQADHINAPLDFPSGQRIANRLAKAAMTEGLADEHGRPGESLIRLYDLWARSGCGILITGNVQVDRNHLERGGNVEGAVANAVTDVEGVKVIAYANVAGRVAASASLLYAKNLLTFLETLVSKETKDLAINLEDELVKATMLTHGGQIVHPNFVKKEG